MEKLFFKPHPILSKYIDRYWMWKYVSDNELEMPVILPGTGLELFIHFNKPFCINDICLPQAHITCPRKYAIINPVRDLDFIAIRFCSGAFRHFSPLPFTEINNSFIGIEDIWGKTGRALLSQLNDEVDIVARVQLIEQFLLLMLTRYKKEDAQFWDSAINKLYYNFHTVELERLAKEKEISYRHFERGFKEQFGITPKRFQMTSRFQNTIKKLLLTEQSNYLPVALDNGYFDQAHFIKTFTTYTGSTPSSFLNERNFMSHFYNTSLK